MLVNKFTEKNKQQTPRKRSLNLLFIIDYLFAVKYEHPYAFTAFSSVKKMFLERTLQGGIFGKLFVRLILIRTKYSPDIAEVILVLDPYNIKIIHKAADV